MTERWRRLPPVEEESATPVVRGLVADLAREAGHEGGVPDLGPDVLPDQLAVVVHDACAAGLPGVLERLTQLRRNL